MTLDQQIRDAESRLFSRYRLQPDESFVHIPSAQVRLRVITVGTGPPLVMLHGVSLAAGIWAPWLSELSGYRAHLIELPGHGLSEPFRYRRGHVREHAIALLDDLFDALELPTAAVVANSLGAMFALWYAAARPGRIASLIALGSPAVALPGVRVRMPLSVMTVPFVGAAMLRNPTPRPLYRRLLGGGLGPTVAAAAPDDLIDVLRLSVRRPGNPRTVGSLMHSIDGFRRPRPESVMAEAELRSIAAPVLFCIGTEDPYLSPTQARPAIANLATAELYELPGGHGPWLEHPVACANLVRQHLRDTTGAANGNHPLSVR